MLAEPNQRPEPTLSEDEQSRLWLSACADGDAQATDAACGLWRDDIAARQTWHRFHLIGDVMRCEQLAAWPARDAAFLHGLRKRLAAEPVVLAPGAPAAGTKTAPAAWRAAWRAAWQVPLAVAASFVLVVGAFTVARLGPMAGEVVAPDGIGAAAVLAAAETRSSDGALLVTDPRLNEFLRAHQAMGGGMQAGAPGGSLRRLDGIVPAVVHR